MIKRAKVRKPRRWAEDTHEKIACAVCIAIIFGAIFALARIPVKTTETATPAKSQVMR